MRAIEHVENYEKAEDKTKVLADIIADLEDKTKVLADIIADLCEDMRSLIRSRKITQVASMISVFNEINQKWRSVARRIDYPTDLFEKFVKTSNPVLYALILKSRKK